MLACRYSLASILVVSLTLTLVACGKQQGTQQQQSGTPKEDAKSVPDPQDTKTAAKKLAIKPQSDPEEQITRSFLRSDSPIASAAKHPGMSELAAVNQVTSSIAESVKSGPTLVVWLFDRTETAAEMVSGVQTALVGFYNQVAQGEIGEGSASNLYTAIVSFGDGVEFLLDEPSNSTAEVVEALAARKRDSSGKEMTFAALQAALEKYRGFRVQRRYDVVFVVVTDEAGDDHQLAETIIDSPEYSPRRLGIPIYVIGVPAPFGRKVGLRGSPEGDNVRQGPESRDEERLSLAFWGGSYGVDLLDSGFGPFALEWLCRDSGGLYLAMRPDLGDQPRFQSQFDLEWPSASAGRFDATVMRRYAPEYISGNVYQAEIARNKAKQALLEAANLGRTEDVSFPSVEFIIRDEARLQRDLNEAQKSAARLEPEIERYYSVLSAGEAERDQVSEPRWQAGFDLAMGRVMAAKARIEGYNHMLAALKRGMNFEKPTSDRWVLESAELTLDAGSGIEKLGARARMYLERVVREHPDTPWAQIAARELKSDVGWKWTEKGPNG